MATLRDVAKTVGMDTKVVREILRETTKTRFSKAEQDRVFSTARKLGYDLKKLKIGKRMHQRKQTLEEILHHIEAHPHWAREEILRYMRNSIQMVERVHKKAFSDEFGAE